MKKSILIPFFISCASLFAQEHSEHKLISNTKEDIRTDIFSLNHLNALKDNPFGLTESIWIQYYNKTNLLLEKIDEQSFLNYVILKADGDFNDVPYFLNHFQKDFKKDLQTLIYKVGKDEINAITISPFFTGLQKNWEVLFSDFQKNRTQIIYESLQTRGSGGENTPITMGCGSACTNPGFESGTSFWNYWKGNACTNSDPCSQVAGLSTSQHKIKTAGGFDPVVGAALPVVPPGGGNHAMMLGDGNISGGNTSRASISFDVSAANTSFTYKYAVVLEDPVSGHTDPERPYFRVKIRNAAGNIVACGDYEVIAKPPIANFISIGNNIYYRPWTTVSVPLTPYVGQCITIEFTTSDCSQGAHYGYAYIDADCSPLEISSSSGSCVGGGLDSLIAPAGAAGYSWSNTAGGTTGIVGSPSNQIITVNQSGTYQVVMTSVTGPTCITTINYLHTMNVSSGPTADFEVLSNPLSGYNPIANFIDKSSSDVVSWDWDFGDGTSHPNTTTPNPSHLYPKIFDAKYNATLIVKNGRGCLDTASREVIVGSEFSFYIPNAFSPNRDGINDYFYGQGVGIMAYRLYIYDRWGNEVFVGKHIDSMWDGKVFNKSEVAQQDVYVWKVVFDDVYGKEHKYTGTVTLVK